MRCFRYIKDSTYIFKTYEVLRYDALGCNTV